MHSSATPIAIIVAVARNGVIGRDNALPWRLPGDLKHFKAVTLGKPVVMGRKTFESIGKPLPGRSNIVISRRADFSAAGATMARDIEAALTLADAVARRDGADEIMVIGGAEIYRQVLPRCQRLYLTRVHAEVEGDAHFPAVDATQWECVSSEDFPAAGAAAPAYTLQLYRRRAG
jgi:dihydrofolate reductase